MPNGQTMKSTHTSTLDIPQLSKSAKSAHIFPAMENNSLLSVGKLCDAGYFLFLSIDEVELLDKKHENIMKGNRDCATGLWLINLYHKKTNCNISQKQPQIHSTNIFYALRNTGALVNCLHKPMFSCT
jgi:hypothetical protein